MLKTPTCVLTKSEGFWSPLECPLAHCPWAVRGYWSIALHHSVVWTVPLGQLDRLTVCSWIDWHPVWDWLTGLMYILGMKGIWYIFLNYGVYFSKYGLIGLLTRHALKRKLNFPLWTLKNQGSSFVKFSFRENRTSLPWHFIIFDFFQRALIGSCASAGLYGTLVVI